MEILNVFAAEGVNGLILFVLMVLAILYFKSSLGALQDTRDSMKIIRDDNLRYHVLKIKDTIEKGSSVPQP